VENFIADIKIPEPEEVKKFNIKIGNKKYGVVKSIMKATFNEWMQYESIVGASPTEKDIVKNLHKILAVYVRPLNWMGKIKKLEDIDIDKNEQEMLKMDLKDALSINLFFYQVEMDFMMNIKRYYLNHRIRKTQVKQDIETK